MPDAQPKPPRCSCCGASTGLIRSAPEDGERPERFVFECVRCGSICTIERSFSRKEVAKSGPPGHQTERPL
jgi:hypothetical protein